MKKYILFLSISIFIISCSEKNKNKDKIQEIPIEIIVDRFDQAFFETPIQNLPKLKSKYPSFFPADVPDSVWTNKMRNPQWRELYGEVQKKYPDFNNKKAEIEDLFRHIKYYYPKTQTPKVVTLIYDMDVQYKTIYADSLVLISLEMYLGKNHKFYEFPEYQKQTFEPSQILPDIVQDFSLNKVKPPTQKDLLSLMIYAGKQLYLKDALLPEYSDEDKIGYSKPQIEWAIAHEVDTWRFFIDENLLYNTDSKLNQRFIAPAPFTKFGLVSDNETSGKMGAWLGWQIVRTFMDNNKDIPLQKMLVMDASEIFQKSKYKPKK
ncbi:gliding motility lipoprotein GldB [Flavobacterium sp.]|uniref:gliding motility lipoprotein GldB n=1 Tax=Flavobacterium sp. TaxID=239 RepID=UPI0037517011